MSELKKLTRLGSDTKKIAALLKAKAPKGHMLAYISPSEAALLKSRGGSGKPHADTGILSFQEEFVPDFAYGEGAVAQTQPAPVFDQGFQSTGTDTFIGTPQQGTPGVYLPSELNLTTEGVVNAMPQFNAVEYYKSRGLPSPTPGGATIPEAAPAGRAAYYAGQDIQDQLAGATGTDLSKPVAIPPQPKAEEASLFGMKPETLARLGLAGGLGLLGSRTAAKAGEVGQRGAQQIQALASPYQAAGQQLQAQAQRGELTPAAQQSIQAAQAQAAQAAERRGGVGAQQAQAQVERLRQQLLQQQYDYGLKLSSIGDNIAMGAIKTGLQADQYVNQLTNQFYTNMAYVASGMAPGVRIGGGT